MNAQTQTNDTAGTVTHSVVFDAWGSRALRELMRQAEAVNVHSEPLPGLPSLGGGAVDLFAMDVDDVDEVVSPEGHT